MDGGLCSDFLVSMTKGGQVYDASRPWSQSCDLIAKADGMHRSGGDEADHESVRRPDGAWYDDGAQENVPSIARLPGGQGQGTRGP